MKVLHINTYDTGGAAIAIKRIHSELLKKGVDSKLLVLHKSKNSEQTYSYFEGLPKPAYERQHLIARILKKIKLKISTQWKSHFSKNRLQRQKDRCDKLNAAICKAEVFSYPTSRYDITLHPFYKEADIIQLNWVSGFLDESTFFSKNKKPVVWRMPDLYACGGGYHYEKNFPFEELKEEISKNIKIRVKALEMASITFVPISNWLKKKLNESKLIQKFDKRIIHNGIDLNVFKPIDKVVARQLFNLPVDKKIILLGAQTITNKRKGYQLFLESLHFLDLQKSENVICCIFGESEMTDTENKFFKKIGTISDERLLCMAYSAADLFVMPSVEEAFGQVTIEALACGLPVVSFPTGGSLDIIKNGINGFLAEDFEAQSLAQAINKALNFQFDNGAIRKDTEVRFNIEDKAEEYIQLYSHVLKNINA